MRITIPTDHEYCPHIDAEWLPTGELMIVDVWLPDDSDFNEIDPLLKRHTDFWRSAEYRKYDQFLNCRFAELIHYNPHLTPETLLHQCMTVYLNLPQIQLNHKNQFVFLRHEYQSLMAIWICEDIYPALPDDTAWLIMQNLMRLRHRAFNEVILNHYIAHWATLPRRQEFLKLYTEKVSNPAEYEIVKSEYIQLASDLAQYLCAQRDDDTDTLFETMLTSHLEYLVYVMERPSHWSRSLQNAAHEFVETVVQKLRRDYKARTIWSLCDAIVNATSELEELYYDED